MINSRFLKSLLVLALCIPTFCHAQTPVSASSPAYRKYPQPLKSEIKCSSSNDCTIVHPKCIGGWVDSPYPVNKKYQEAFLKRTKDFCASRGYGIIVDGLGEGVLQCKLGQCSFGTCAQARPDKPGWQQCERYILQHPDLSPKRYTEVLLNDIYNAIQNYKKHCGYYPSNEEGFGVLFSLRDTGRCKSEVSDQVKTKAAEDFQKEMARQEFDPRKDGWSEPISYSSDGEKYKITASHGYWISQKSGVQKNGLHWTNRNPPNESPSFDPLCYGDFFGKNCPADITQQEKYRFLSEEAFLDNYYNGLDEFKSDCGRYPTTDEGLHALYEAPKTVTCKKSQSDLSNLHPLDYGLKDAWEVPFKYTSDGKTYRLTASHGYYLTQESPKNDHGFRWSNENPQPYDGSSAKRETEKTLDLLYNALAKFKESCGRYPSSKEGIEILSLKGEEEKDGIIKPISNFVPKDCKNYEYEIVEDWGSSQVPVDGWGKPLSYSADGKNYVITASHGYMLTPDSHRHGIGYHWTNPHPPKSHEPEVVHKVQD